jgi:adenylyltransferase/sulfurtransferase
MYLAAAGVGTLGIVEFDEVDESNLQRQIIHGQSDVGRSKAESARDSVLEINPLITVNVHEVRLDSSNVMEIFEPYDLIVDGTDNFATRYLVNDACVLLGKPYVWGSIYRFDGQASVFWAEHGPCYRCLYPEPPPPGMVPSCAEGGVLGAMCGIVGSIQANEAIKILARIGTPLFGRLQVLNALDMEIRTLKLRRDKHCPICSDRPTISKLIDYQEFCGLPAANASKPVMTNRGIQLNVNPAWEVHPAEVQECRQRGEEMLILDVRQLREWNAAQIKGATLIPLHELDARAGEIAEWKDRRVVVHCHHGSRSMNGTAILRKKGFTNVHSMAGGIDAWSLIVDPAVPRY